MIKALFGSFILCFFGYQFFSYFTFHEIPSAVKVDRIVVGKKERKLTILNNGVKIKEYTVSLGKNSVGKKNREGDGKTPEGLYIIDYHKKDSSYHLALHISYPNEVDASKAKENDVAPGGAIMIHGIRNGLGWVGGLHKLVDWTAGCIAVTNREIEEIWRAVPDGTIIEITP